MDSSKNTTNLNHPNVSQDLLASITLSDSAEKLDSVVKRRYLEKIQCVGIDPVLIQGKNFDSDSLPPVESADILCYLVLETSYYTKEKFKNYQSPEALNQLISGFTISVQGHTISNKKSTHRSFAASVELSATQYIIYQSCVEISADPRPEMILRQRPRVIHQTFVSHQTQRKNDRALINVVAANYRFSKNTDCIKYN